MKLVSVIVPVCSESNLILDCYNRLINQLYNNIEIIFVCNNNFKIKNTLDDNRVEVVNCKNDDLSELRKYGLKKSHGEYICFLDINDIIDKKFIYKLVKSMENNNVNISVGRLGCKYYNTFIVSKDRRKPKIIDLEKKKEYLPTIRLGLVGKLFKRELLESKKYDFKNNEDLVLYMEGRYISFVNSAKYYSYDNNIQCSDSYKFKNVFNIFESLKDIYNKYQKLDKLEEYFYELEMIFIKKISFLVGDVIDNVSDKIYKYKFISGLFNYLEYFFPDWDKNPYYVRGYKLGEACDRKSIRRMYNEMLNLKRKKLYISLEQVYDRYKNIEMIYNKIGK